MAVFEPSIEQTLSLRVQALHPNLDPRDFACWYDSDRAYLLVKRVFDVVAVSVALVLLLPLMLLIGLLVALERSGPVLYTQERVGQHGRRFAMYKFRTMRPDRRRRANDRRQRDLPIDFPDRRRRCCHGAYVDRRRSLKAQGDPRVSALGRFLRETSLDELPQLLNILRGDMSLVGPRPEQLEMLQYYRPHHYLRHLAVPGLTGWWQINARCHRANPIEPHEDLHQKLTDDLHYLENRSFLFDLRVLVQTVPIVLGRRGSF